VKNLLEDVFGEVFKNVPKPLRDEVFRDLKNAL
jgi:hypothetical protein